MGPRRRRQGLHFRLIATHTLVRPHRRAAHRLRCRAKGFRQSQSPNQLAVETLYWAQHRERMRPATRVRVTLLVELLIWMAAMVAASFPGFICLLELFGMGDDRSVMTFSRLQLAWTMLLSGPVFLMLVGGMLRAGSATDPLFSLRLHARIALVLLAPTTLAALLRGGEEFAQTMFSLPWWMAVPLVLLPIGPAWVLRSLRDRTEAQRRHLAIVRGFLALAVLLNVGVGLLAFMEIGTWV